MGGGIGLPGACKLRISRRRHLSYQKEQEKRKIVLGILFYFLTFFFLTNHEVLIKIRDWDYHCKRLGDGFVCHGYSVMFFLTSFPKNHKVLIKVMIRDWDCHWKRLGIGYPRDKEYVEG